MTRRIRPDRRSRAHPPPRERVQVLVVWTLLAGGFWEPFLFCLGFLASRLVRFCSLFATTASLQVSGGNYAAGARQCNRQIKAVAAPANPQRTPSPVQRSLRSPGEARCSRPRLFQIPPS